MCIHIYAYPCPFPYECVSVHTCAYLFLYVSMCPFLCVGLSILVCVCTSLFLCVYACVHSSVCMYMSVPYACVCKFPFTYVRLCVYFLCVYVCFYFSYVCICLHPLMCVCMYPFLSCACMFLLCVYVCVHLSPVHVYFCALSTYVYVHSLACMIYTCPFLYMCMHLPLFSWRQRTLPGLRCDSHLDSQCNSMPGMCEQSVYLRPGSQEPKRVDETREMNGSWWRCGVGGVPGDENSTHQGERREWKVFEGPRAGLPSRLGCPRPSCPAEPGLSLLRVHLCVLLGG